MTAAPVEPPEDPPLDGPAEAYDRDMVNAVQVRIHQARFENAVLGAVDAHHPPRSRLTRATGRVDDYDVTRALGRFVQPDGFGPAAERLAREHLLVLRGPAGTGKRSSALALLRQVTTDALYLMSPHVSPAELADYDFSPGCGYLVVDRTVDRDAADTDFGWRVVRDHVEDLGCYLVVTEPAAAGDDAERFGCLDWPAPAPVRVLRAHWDGVVPDDQRRALDEALTSVHRVRDVVDLAARLAGGWSWDAALEHLDARVGAEVERWFDAAPDRGVLEVTALAFALGADERMFEAALRSLERRVTVAAEDTVEEGLRQHRSGWRANALIATTTRHTELGRRGAVRFAKPEHHRHVLAQLFQRMDVTFWDAVGDWLDEVVADARYEVPVALGVAELAPIAPAEVVSLLDRWAAGARGRAGQRAAVYALHLIAYDESLAPVALKIAVWWVDRGKAQQRWVAAMAFVGGLGIRYPHDARRRLWQMSVQSHAKNHMLERLFGDLFATLDAETDNAHLVLDFLAGKLARFTRPGASTAGRAVAMRTALAVLDSRIPGANRPAVPAHLVRFPRHADLVARLLANVVSFRPTRLRALDALLSLLDEPDARGGVRGLGAALRRVLPEDEHDLLEEDLRVVAGYGRRTPGHLVDDFIDAFRGRVPRPWSG
ncbi:hypothetical protein [Saccharothrix obliqua]|uniref:hypothetical protein n=1 Tax=Saccharothrix obliqua TaxID=2861747 RepID=UPI001C5FF1F1|nr:hypothetical protein [Saccharothrix obliqua]MBW4719676.1 hypothetical protein [Saccharothrix obliqua]